MNQISSSDTAAQGVGLSDADQDLEAFLSYRISVTARMIDRQTAQILSVKFGLGMLEWHILSQLALHAPMTVQTLAERTRFDKGAISRASASLERQGLISRSDDPRDGRSSHFRQTPKGRRLFAKIFQSRQAFQRELRSVLSDEENTILLHALEKIERQVANMRALDV